MIIRNHALLDQLPSKLPPERIDRARARQLIEVCQEELPPYLGRVLGVAELLNLDLRSAEHCKIIAHRLGVTTSTLRAYKQKIRDRCQPLREEFVALHEENPND